LLILFYILYQFLYIRSFVIYLFPF